MAIFRNISPTVMLTETMRWFATNRDGNPSKLYKFLFAVVYVLQNYFQSFSAWRDEKFIIANCKWQIGQLTNVLNYFFDPVNKTIYIDQVTLLDCFVPDFTVNPSTVFVPDLTVDPSTVFVPDLDSTVIITEVIIHVPSPYYTPGTPENTALIAVLEQIKITGIPYTITNI